MNIDDTRNALTEVWPQFGLRLRTPRLELRLPLDAELAAPANVAARGVHPSGESPFTRPWAEAPSPELERSTLQHQWKKRAEWSRERWDLIFAVFLGDEPIGSQDAHGEDFATKRVVRSGSWLGAAYQGVGYGTEMRAALAAFAFELGAAAVESEALATNPRSIGVSKKLGYRDMPGRDEIVDGRSEPIRVFRLARADWEARRASLPPVEIEGLDACRALLGADAPAR